MTKDEALKLALEALEWSDNALLDGTPIQVNQQVAISAIKEALAQPQQEPVVWMYQDKSTHEVRFQKHMRDFVDHSKTSEVPLYSEPLANHELQCVCGAVWCGDEMVYLPNKAPPQRNPLTRKEVLAIIDKHPAEKKTGLPMFYRDQVLDIARAIEAAHGIKE